MHTATRKSDSKATSSTPTSRGMDGLLTDLVTAHEWMLRATVAHREAMRRAEPGAMAATRDEISAASARITELDAERRALVASLAPDDEDATLSSLAAGLREPQRSRTLELAGTLRELIVQATAEQRRLRAASEAMLRHVRGVVQQVQRGLSHAGTYGRAGRVEPGAAVVTGIDMTT